MTAARVALFDDNSYIETPNLADRFGVPPFSTIDTRSGLWASIRARWAPMFDINDNAGREDTVTYGGHGVDEVSRKIRATKNNATSIFDPALAELILRWWAPPGGTVYDPFAGGPSRGMVAAYLGYSYTGLDLSTDQIAANQAALAAAPVQPDYPPVWTLGDAAVDRIRPGTVDFVYTCPPYGTLERYSDNPADLSTMKAAAFRGPYKTAIAHAVDALKPDRFAVYVVGNYREGGRLIDLAGLTIEAHADAGAEYYGDLILINTAASAAMRASASFDAGRKPVRTHQLVLVFTKGDGMKAARACQ